MPRSTFNYLRVNPQTGEAEMHYHIEFADSGRAALCARWREVYAEGCGHACAFAICWATTQRCTRTSPSSWPDGTQQEIGIGYLKFRTFENLAAVSNLAGFLASFQVTGTSDPVIQLQARLRFIAFTAQFVQREFDPLALPSAQAATGPAT